MSKSFKLFLLAICVAVSFSSSAFDYDLDFKGMDVPLLKRMGCKCDSATDVEFFYSKYNSDVARMLHHRFNMRSGVLKKNTSAAKGFMGSFDNQSIYNFYPDKEDVDRFVVFVAWPEFGD
jgi:hypothetical protein